MKSFHTSLLIAISFCLYLFPTFTAKGQIEIFPFKISVEVVNYETVDVGKIGQRNIIFQNTLAEPVFLETHVLHPAFKRNSDSIVKIPAKGETKVTYTFNPQKPESVNTKMTFLYWTAQNPNKQEGARAIQIKAIGTGVLLKAQMAVVEFGQVFLGDTAKNSLVIKNIGNKTAEFKVTTRVFSPNSLNKDFEIDSVFLNIEHKLEPDNETRIPFKFFPNRVGLQEAECKLRIGEDNPKPGYEALAIIKMRGMGIKRPPLIEIVTIPEKLSVGIGNEMSIPLSIEVKRLPEEVKLVRVAGKIAFREGTLGVLTTDNNTGVVINDRRVIEFEATLDVDNNLSGNIPIRFVGALGDSDTTTLSVYDCRFYIGNEPIKSEFEKASSTVSIEGFQEVNGQKRILQSRGEGDVVIMANKSTFSSDISMKCIGLQRDADVSIYDSGGNLVYESEIKAVANPEIMIPHRTLNFGTYTAVLVYGTQYSTKRFIVIP